MRVDCFSDLHGDRPELHGGDLLIVAGDLTAWGKPDEYQRFYHWMDRAPYALKVFIAGNHDTAFVDTPPPYISGSVKYLQDSGCEFMGLKIWGSPWQLGFPRQNPDYAAFSVLWEDQLKDAWAMIWPDTDILITHCPPEGILDRSERAIRCGSPSLLQRIQELEYMRLHVFGHIHEGRGVTCRHHGYGDLCRIHVNAANLDRNYKSINAAITVEL